MRLSMEQIRDLEEDQDSEEEDIRAEEELTLFLKKQGAKTPCNDLSHEAEKALRSAPSMTWAEFCKKWR